jgi:hypothetical protein
MGHVGAYALERIAESKALARASARRAETRRRAPVSRPGPRTELSAHPEIRTARYVPADGANAMATHAPDRSVRPDDVRLGRTCRGSRCARRWASAAVDVRRRVDGSPVNRLPNEQRRAASIGAEHP